MNLLLLFCVLMGLSPLVQAKGMGLPPTRFVYEKYEDARDRHLSVAFDRWSARNNPTFFRSNTAERKKQPLEAINFDSIPQISSTIELQKHFEFIRDTRFLQTEDTHFPRRLTWLFPDDGCYARAEVAKNTLSDQPIPIPKKIFVFGSLSAQTVNSPYGSVQWWYHVAITYRVNGDVYVLDPALEPHRPLSIQEWNNLVGGQTTQVRYTICHANTFDPMADCGGADAITPQQAIEEQKSFLDDEWNRLLELDRDPDKELGEFPPWK